MSGFYRYAQADPDHVAVVDPDGTEHRAGDLLARANRWVHALRGRSGSPRGTPWPPCCPTAWRPSRSTWQRCRRASYYVPINYRSRPREVAYILADSEAKAFVSHERFGALAAAAADEAGIPEAAALRPRLDHRVPARRGGARRAARLPARRPRRRRRDALHLGHHRQAEGREAGAAAVRRRRHGRALHGLLRAVRHPPPARTRSTCAPRRNYHTAVTTFAGNALHSGHTRGVHGQVGPGGDAGQDRAAPGHAHPHGPDAVPPHAAAAGGREGRSTTCRRCGGRSTPPPPCPVDVKRKMLDWWGPVIWEYYAATEGGGTTATPEDWLKYPGTVGKPVGDL